jgi:CBS domain-containing protein
MPVFKRFQKMAAITVAEVMSSPPISVKSDSSLRAAVETMWKMKVGSVIVVDSQGNLAGIVTERDVIYSAASGLFEQKSASVGAVMSRNVITVGPQENLSVAIDKMRSFNLRHIVVVDPKPVGMVAMRDVLDVSLRLLALFFPPD